MVQRAVLISAILLGFVAWRQGRIINSLILPPTLPPAYYVHGNVSTHCTRIVDPIAHELSYCEDEVFWDVHHGDGTLLARRLVVSCDPNRKNWNTVMGPLRDPDPLGALWVVSFDADESWYKPQKIKLEGYPAHKDFHPLGVEISPSRAGNASNLFVVNHGRRFSTVEQFLMHPDQPATAHFVRSIISPYFKSPNALALTSPTSFYVSNDHYWTRRLPSILGKTLPLIETFLALPLAFVSHVSMISDAPGAAVFDHKHPGSFFAFPNGIALSADGNTLAVASSSTGAVRFYARNASTNALKLESTVPVPFAADNIQYDDEGILLVTGHPNFPGLVKLAAAKGEVAPSWVIALRRRSTDNLPTEKLYDQKAPYSAAKQAPAVKDYEVETLYQSDGTHFSSSTTALRDTGSGALFVTGLYDEGVLVCKP